MSDANSFFGSHPTFHVEGQEDTALASHLIALVIHETADTAPRCEATFTNWDGAALIYPDDRAIALAGPLVVRRGEELLFSGHITALEGRFPAAWPAELRVVATGAVSDAAAASHAGALRLVHGASLREVHVTIEHGAARPAPAPLPTRSPSPQVDRTVARGLAVPSVELRVGVQIELEGIGPGFGGTFQVRETRHLFDLAQGLRTEFVALRRDQA